jgi:hypothetical protein
MKHSSEQMQLVVNEWQASGLSKKEFCRQRNMTYQTFHYWCKRLIGGPSLGFTEVCIQSHETGSGCEIIFPSGTRMIFRGEPSASWLREILR